jgi:uncharacterized protein
VNQLTFVVTGGVFSLCSLGREDAIPSWALSSAFYAITKTSDELSVVCESHLVPADTKQDSNWRMLKIDAVLDLSLTGITSKFSAALANADVNLCVIATYETDYVLVKEEKLQTAITALQNAGFIIKQ